MDNTCLHCGRENRPKAKFCANCGQTLPAATLVAVGADDPPERAAAVVSAPLVSEQLIPAPYELAPATLSAAANVSTPLPDVAPNEAAALTAADEVITPLDLAIEPIAVQGDQPALSRQAADSAPVLVPSVADGQNAPPPTNLVAPAPDDASADGHEPTDAPNRTDAPAMTDGPVTDPVVERSVVAEPVLDVGTLIAERHLVVSYAEASFGQSVYQVEDHGVCRSCGVVVQATEEEPYCFNCGAHLFQSTLPWPLHNLREVAPDPDNADLLTWQAHTFALESAGTEQGEEKDVPAPSPFVNGVNLLVGQRSHVGVGRAGAPDEDSLFAITLTGVYEAKAQPTVGLYIVADGMGGHGDGEVASRITTETIATALLPTLLLPIGQGEAQSSATIVEQINRAIQMANQRVHEGARARNNDMGTTLTLALIVNDQVYVANVGDSRTYLWGRSGLRQITQDHSHVYSLYKNGALSEEGIYTHPRRNEIYRSLGIGNTVTVDHFQEQLTPGDLVLLCCDGLWEMVRNDGLTDVLMLNLGEPQIICDELVSRANLAGGEDNISVVVVRAVA